MSKNTIEVLIKLTEIDNFEFFSLEDIELINILCKEIQHECMQAVINNFGTDEDEQ